MTQYRLIIASDPDDLARQCAERIASCIDLALAERDRAQIALAGGETPKPAYERLGREHLPWERVDVLLGDERWVDPEDPASNARMLRETLLAQPPALNARFHPVPTDAESPAADAAQYAEALTDLCSGTPPRLDLEGMDKVRFPPIPFSKIQSLVPRPRGNDCNRASGAND